MIVRRPTLNELPKLRELHKPFQEQFCFPDFHLVSSVFVVIDGTEIIGFGTLQPIVEATVILDQGAPKSSRLEALKLLQAKAEEEAPSQIHIFVQDKGFFNLMKKRFGYKSTKGNALVKVVK